MTTGTSASTDRQSQTDGPPHIVRVHCTPYAELGAFFEIRYRLAFPFASDKVDLCCRYGSLAQCEAFAGWQMYQTDLKNRNTKSVDWNSFSLWTT